METLEIGSTGLLLKNIMCYVEEILFQSIWHTWVTPKGKNIWWNLLMNKPTYLPGDNGRKEH